MTSSITCSTLLTNALFAFQHASAKVISQSLAEYHVSEVREMIDNGTYERLVIRKGHSLYKPVGIYDRIRAAFASTDK